MIVPQSRLLFWFTVIVLPFAALGAVVPGAMLISAGIITVLLVVLALDALLARRALAGIGVETPAIARMSKDREAKLELHIRNARQQAQTLRLALPLPREIQSPQDEILVALPGGSEWSRLNWPCRPLRRGSFRVDLACLEGRSPLGFWAVRTRVPARSEIRVYPNLLAERKSLAALFLNRGAFGVHAQRQVGKGREFEKLREYVPGDSFDDIHWKATAKRGRPVTKVFQIERTQEVYVVIDTSRLSAREPEAQGLAPQPAGSPAVAAQSQPPTTLERFVTAALVLGLAAERQGDLFGLVTFSDQIGTFLRARNGKGHYAACRDAIYAAQPRAVNPDYDEVCTFIRLRLRRRALLVFLTALDDPVLAESFERDVRLISRQHLVLVNQLQPPGAVPLFSGAGVGSVDQLYQALGGHERWRNLQELGRRLQRRGVQFALLENEKLSAQLVTQYLSVKRRQLL